MMSLFGSVSFCLVLDPNVDWAAILGHTYMKYIALVCGIFYYQLTCVFEERAYKWICWLFRCLPVLSLSFHVGQTLCRSVCVLTLTRVFSSLHFLKLKHFGIRVTVVCHTLCPSRCWRVWLFTTVYMCFCCCWVAPPAMHRRWPEAGQSAAGKRWYTWDPP